MYRHDIRGIDDKIDSFEDAVIVRVVELFVPAHLIMLNMIR